MKSRLRTHTLDSRLANFWEALELSLSSLPVDRTTTAKKLPAAAATKPKATPIAKPKALPTQKATPAEQAAGAKYVVAFGRQGAVWFCEGKTFEECQKLFASDPKFAAALAEEHRAELTERLRFSGLTPALIKVAANLKFAK